MCTDKKIPHKHAAMIKAWADGAEVQYQDNIYGEWHNIAMPTWSLLHKYRIKPEPKPDTSYCVLVFRDSSGGVSFMRHSVNPNLKITYDGETGNLKSVEII